MDVIVHKKMIQYFVMMEFKMHCVEKHNIIIKVNLNSKDFSFQNDSL